MMMMMMMMMMMSLLLFMCSHACCASCSAKGNVKGSRTCVSTVYEYDVGIDLNQLRQLQCRRQGRWKIEGQFKLRLCLLVSRGAYFK
jgi:hypothetical protein